MKVTTTPIEGLLVLEPRVFGDERGFFFESWNRRVFNQAVGAEVEFVQDNHSRSTRGVLRGLHYQASKPQGKLVRVVSGAVFDVAVDLRPGSPTMLKWFGLELSGENKKQLWIPEGFAHGFVTLTDEAEVLYKATDFYDADCDRSLRYDAAELAIGWPIDVDEANLSAKDANAMSLEEALAEKPFG